MDFNVSNYSDKELENIVGIEGKYDESILNGKVAQFSQWILQSDNEKENDSKMKFILDLRDRLYENIRNFIHNDNNVVEGIDNTLVDIDLNSDSEGEGEGEGEVEGEGEIEGEGEGEVEGEGLVDGVGEIDAKNTRLNEVIVKNNINTVVFDKLVTVDSSFRRIYNQRCSCNDVKISTFKVDTPDDFTVTFNEGINNVSSIEINTVELTHAWYNFQYAKGNTVFKINDSVVKIPDGSYLPARIANELTNVNIESINLLDTIEEVDNDALGGADSDLTYKYDITQHKIIIENTSNVDISLCFYDEDMGNNHNAKLDYNLGRMLGFTENDYVVPASGELRGENTIHLYGPTYIYLAIDDYTNNYFTQSMTMQSVNKDVFRQSKYFRDNEYLRDVGDRTNIPQYSREGSRPAQTRTVTQKLTNSQKKTIEEIKLAQENQYQNRAYGPNVMDIIARIPIKYDEGNEIKKWSPLIYENLRQYKRMYIKPVNINKLRIRLFDDKGFPLGMINDWSMSLVFKTNREYAKTSL